MNNQKQQKLWESAYNVVNHPRMGPYMHGAGMVERTTGVPHFWLVRGPCTRSVVQELQQQLGKAYNFPRLTNSGNKPEPKKPEPKNASTDRTFAGLLFAVVVGVALCAFSRKPA